MQGYFNRFRLMTGARIVGNCLDLVEIVNAIACGHELRARQLTRAHVGRFSESIRNNQTGSETEIPVR